MLTPWKECYNIMSPQVTQDEKYEVKLVRTDLNGKVHEEVTKTSKPLQVGYDHRYKGKWWLVTSVAWTQQKVSAAA